MRSGRTPIAAGTTGHTIRGATAEAAARGVPVLHAAHPLDREALERFCGAGVRFLVPDPATVTDRVRQATGDRSGRVAEIPSQGPGPCAAG